MKILTLITSRKYDAGPKAPKDIETILCKEYNLEKDTVYAKKDTFKEKIMFLLSICKIILKNIGYKDVIFIQYPFTDKSNIILRLLPTKKTILIIHDITYLRLQDNKKLKKEINLLKRYNYIVVHNNKMKEFLQKQGIQKEKMKTLDLFDYLCNKPENEETRTGNKKIVVYAGNLLKKKSPFLYELDNEKMNFEMNIYGVGVEEIKNSKIKYKGKYLPDELPNHLEGNLGLVWDGNWDERDENERFKNYTKYNNPHKLSCYIAAELPVVVWKKSAIADFVKANDIGYIISNIYEINELDLSDYRKKLNNVKRIRKNVLEGKYMINVIKRILKELN